MKVLVDQRYGNWYYPKWSREWKTFKNKQHQWTAWKLEVINDTCNCNPSGRWDERTKTWKTTIEIFPYLKKTMNSHISESQTQKTWKQHQGTSYSNCKEEKKLIISKYKSNGSCCTLGKK